MQDGVGHHGVFRIAGAGGTAALRLVGSLERGCFPRPIAGRACTVLGGSFRIGCLRGGLGQASFQGGQIGRGVR